MRMGVFSGGSGIVWVKFCLSTDLVISMIDDTF